MDDNLAKKPKEPLHLFKTPLTPEIEEVLVNFGLVVPPGTKFVCLEDLNLLKPGVLGLEDAAKDTWFDKTTQKRYFINPLTLATPGENYYPPIVEEEST